MLRLRSRPVWIGLCTRQVGAVRVHGAAVTALGCADVVPAFESGTFDQGVNSLLQALEGLIDEHDLAGSRAQVVLSNRLVRYALVPFDPAHLDRHEEQALALARLSACYGPMTDWSIRLEPARYGRTRLACAIPTALEQGLRALCTAHQIRLRRVSPHFVCCWNARPAAFRRAGMLAVAECDTLLLASTDSAGWHSMRVHYANLRDGQFDDLVYRERLMQRIDPAIPLWLDGSALPERTTLAAAGATAVRDARPAIALAMAGRVR